MAFRNNNRRNFSGGNYGGGSGMGRNMSPWENAGGAGGNFGSGRNQGGQGSGVNADALTYNLLHNLFRNQNPPSLLDLPRNGGGGGGGMDGRGSFQMGNRGINRNRRGQGFGRGQKSGSNNKGGGIRKLNVFDRAKKLLAKNSKPKKDSGENKDKKKTESSSSPKSGGSLYADVPNSMFYCHLCKKDMWDATSFVNHIKGRTHMMMREGIEESYRLKANMIRQEAKIAEQLKMLELDRLKRMGKSKAAPREYCTMCDLTFSGHLSAHRKTEGHLALKKFLHPKCVECSQEFPTRIEYDTHLLSPEHLKKAAECNTRIGERKKKTLNILTEEEELKDVRQPAKKKKVEKKEGETTEEGDEKKENGEEMKEEVKEDGTEEGKVEIKKEGEEHAEDEKMEEDANATLVEDPDDCILDFSDGDEIPPEVDTKLPKYNWQRPVGSSLISKLECYECCICGKFFDTEKTVEVHSRTVSHHRNFLKFINEKSSETRIAQKRAAAAIEENERKKMKLEADANGEDEGGEECEHDGDGEHEGEGEGDGEHEGDDEKAGEGDLYDPSEATADDEDVEMNENPEDEQGHEGEGDQEVEAEAEAEADVEAETKPEVEVKVEVKNDPELNGKKEAEVKDEPMEEDPKKEEEKIEADQKKPEPTTPTTTPTTPKPVLTPAAQKQGSTPMQKGTPAANRGGNQGRGTPRNRGRGRYNRY